MKGYPRWIATVTVIVGLMIVVQLLAISLVLFKILPKFADVLQQIGAEPPVFLVMLYAISHYVAKGWPYLVGIVVLAEGIFEWRVRRETKSMIRLTAFALTCLAVTIFAVILSLFALVASSITWGHNNILLPPTMGRPIQ